MVPEIGRATVIPSHPSNMVNRGDRDILLPQEHDPWQILRDLRSLLPRRRPRPAPPAEVMEPGDLCLAFEYLAAECQAAGHLLENLAEPLAAKMAALTGQGRFAVQCTLAESLGDQKSARFFLALHLATRVPVPQARSPLLRMLTQAGLAHWSFRQQTRSNGRGAEGERGTGGATAAAPGDSGDGPARTFDFRPAVVAALGQLRDPSLLGLFHRLLEKLSGSPANDPIVAAVQWSLMNLAPGGQGEPVPVSILNGKTDAGENNASAPKAPAEGTPARQSPAAHSSGNGHTSQSMQDAPSERSDLLGGF